MTKGSRAKKICFFITPIGKSDSKERKRADNIQRYILNEVLASKYKIVRADELPQPGSITHQIVSLLYRADLVVADLTGSNANVAYELAVRHAFNKVAIHLIDRADDIPFDLKDERTIAFDLSDLESVNSCKDELKKVVHAVTRGKVQYSSLVFRALGIDAATAQEKEGFLEQIADQVESIATDVSSIDNAIMSSDLDEIASIKEELEALGEKHEEIEERFDTVDAALRKIIEKLG